jgi:hypothetical protein
MLSTITQRCRLLKLCAEIMRQTGMVLLGDSFQKYQFRLTHKSLSIAALYWKITTMKLLLIVGGCICALASLWGAVAICGMWLLVSRDHSMTAPHDILIRLAYTALFFVASAVFGTCSLWAFRKTGTLQE